jgi:hypothetical protein
MGKGNVINDTCNVTFKRLSDGVLVFTTEAQLASVAQTIKEEKLRGGIGNNVISILRSDKEINGKVNNALFNTEWLEMVTGTKFASGTANIIAQETDITCTTAGELAVTGTPIANTISVVKPDGTILAGTATFGTGKVTLTGILKDTIYSVTYQKSVSGQVLPVLLDTYSENYAIEYSTVEYDPVTNKIVKDLIWQFDRVSIASQFDYSYEGGKAIGSMVEFSILTPLNGGSEVGRVIEVTRA